MKAKCHRNIGSLSVTLGLHRNDIYKEVSQKENFCSETLLFHRHFPYKRVMCLKTRSFLTLVGWQGNGPHIRTPWLGRLMVMCMPISYIFHTQKYILSVSSNLQKMMKPCEVFWVLSENQLISIHCTPGGPVWNKMHLAARIAYFWNVLFVLDFFFSFGMFLECFEANSDLFVWSDWSRCKSCWNPWLMTTFEVYSKLHAFSLTDLLS